MLDPDIIPALRRRIAALAIDLGLVGLLTALVGRSRFQRFAIADRTPGTNEPIWTSEQFTALSDLSQGFNRKFERGDTLFVIDGMGVLLTLLVGLVLTSIVFVAVPANTGWSPGKKLLGLRVIDSDANTPPLLAFVARTIVGVIDLIPFLVPGLLGFVLARNHSDGHRLGDRIAGTTVVDARKPVRYVDRAVMERRASLQSDDAHRDDNDAMIDLGDRLGSTPRPVDSAPDAQPPEPQAPAQAKVPRSPERQPQSENQPGGHPLPSHRSPLASADTPAVNTPAVNPPAVNPPTVNPPAVNTAWEAPVAEPAPVWHPTDIQQPQAQQPQAQQPQAGAPVWNEQWAAWLFWDPDAERWLRHDEATGAWIPIS